MFSPLMVYPLPSKVPLKGWLSVPMGVKLFVVFLFKVMLAPSLKNLPA